MNVKHISQPPPNVNREKTFKKEVLSSFRLFDAQITHIRGVQTSRESSVGMMRRVRLQNKQDLEGGMAKFQIKDPYLKD